MLDKRNNKGYNHQINIAELDAGTQCLASNFRCGNFYIDSFEVGLMFITLQSTKQGEQLYIRNDFELLDNDMTISKLQEEVDCIPRYLPLKSV